MLEHAVYSVISPEGCASILWRSSAQAQDAAEALRLTASDLLKLGVIDGVVDEPLGGAHRGPDETIAAVGDRIEEAMGELNDEPGPALREKRREKFIEMGHKALS
jgi:acetyl-CoA carboxylase carboxyl transferase subunit alpha